MDLDPGPSSNTGQGSATPLGVPKTTVFFRCSVHRVGVGSFLDKMIKRTVFLRFHPLTNVKFIVSSNCFLN